MRVLIVITYFVALIVTALLALPGFLQATSAPQQAAAASPAIIAYVIARIIEKICVNARQA